MIVKKQINDINDELDVAIEDVMSATDRPFDRYKIDKDFRSAERLGEGIEQMIKIKYSIVQICVLLYLT